MDIVIVGAGISGCAAYLMLKKHLPQPLSAQPHSIVIYEAHDTHPDATSSQRGPSAASAVHSATLVVGGGLGVGANGLHVLKRLDEDILHDVVRGGYVTPTMVMKSKNGTVLARVQATGSPSPDAGSPVADMHMVATSRHSLWRCLRLRIPDAAISTRRVAKVTASSGGRNLVSFVDGGPPVEADLVIGADGLKSVARQALFPEAADEHFSARYEGLVGVGGFVPSDKVEADVERGSMNFVFGGNGFFGYFFADSHQSSPYRDSPFHVSAPGQRLAWWSTFAADDCPTPGSLDVEAVTQKLRERHGSWKDPVVQRLLPSLYVDNMYPTWTVPPLPNWERDGVVLVGDAAHALPTTSGQGSSQALEDVEALALFLGHHLRKAYQEHRMDHPSTRKDTIKVAAKQYVEMRLPRVTGILHEAQRMQTSKRDMSLVQEYAMYTVLWILGCFPRIMSRTLADTVRYNVAEEVKKVLKQINGLFCPVCSRREISFDDLRYCYEIELC